ncbi:hypothetical protein I2F17_00780 [Acinetobacter sp. B10A]|nr:hypothetical protein [Acinetobacter baretiae]
MTLNIKYLPAYSYREQHCMKMKASPEQAMNAILNYKTNDDCFFRCAIALRELPYRIYKFFCKEKSKLAPFSLDHFTLLDIKDKQEVIFGLVGQLWKWNYGQVRITDRLSFLDFRQKNHVKLTLYFSIQKINDVYVRVTTETRVLCIDQTALVKFRPHWYLIRPVSGWIRYRMLLQIQKNIFKSI